MRMNRESTIPLVMILLLLVGSLSILVPFQLERSPLPPEEYIRVYMFQEILNDTRNEFQYTLPENAIRCDVSFISTNGSPVSLRLHNATNSIIELRNLTNIYTDFVFETTHSYTYYVTVTRQTQNDVTFSLVLNLWFLRSSQSQITTSEDYTFVIIIAAIFTGIVISWFVQKASTLHSLCIIKRWRGMRFRNEIIPFFILAVVLVSALSLYPLISGLIVGNFEEVPHKEVLKRETHSVFLNSENSIAWMNITVPDIDIGQTTDMNNLPLPIYLQIFDISTNGEPILINRGLEEFIIDYENGQHDLRIRISTTSGAVISLRFELVSSEVEFSFNAEIYRYVHSPLANPMFVISSALLGVGSLVFSLVLAPYIGIDNTSEFMD